MEKALGANGDLHPVLAAVVNHDRLRLEIRELRFNVYYGGGNLMLVDGRKTPWAMHFDEKYFKGGGLEPPILPSQLSSVNDSHAWVKAFPELIAGMEDWWTRHPKRERAICQEMASANSARTDPPPADYLVLDLEYQWAQRRFDMVAAKRNPTGEGKKGWSRPDLIFVEVKCEYSACNGTSGLAEHARDYKDIVTARKGLCVQNIKAEFENMIAQKMRLGLLHTSLGFKQFSNTIPRLLIVMVDLDLKNPSLEKPLEEVKAISNALGRASNIQLMQLDSPEYRMTTGALYPL